MRLDIGRSFARSDLGHVVRHDRSPGSVDMLSVGMELLRKVSAGM